MNFGIVTTWFERGAAYVSKQFEDVLSIDNNVFIYARGGEAYAKGDPKWDKPNVTWGKRSLLFGPTQINIKHLQKWIKANSIEVLLFNEQHEWAPVIDCSRMDVITGAYIDYYKKETVPLFGAYDFLICNTRRHHSVFDWHPQAFYVPWGTNLSVFKPQANFRKDKRIVFFHSCGMNPYRKGTDILLEAFSIIERTAAKLIIHSQVNVKSFFPDKGKLIDELLQEGSLEIIEKSVHAPGLYHLGDVYVYPTRLEGIGLTIAEAISCGLPAIVTDQRPMNEFVGSSAAGRLIKVHHEEMRGDNYYWPQSIADVQSLANQMEFFIKEQKDIQIIKKEAREYALNNLDWNRNLVEFGQKLKDIQKIYSSDKSRAIEMASEYDNCISAVDTFKKTLLYRRCRSILKNK